MPTTRCIARQMGLISLMITLSFVQFAHAKTPMDANKNGEITEREYLNYFSADFIKADKNFDAQLSREELNAARQIRMQDGAKKRFKRLDADNDSFISVDEYNADREKRREKQQKNSEKQIDRWFDNVDSNKNGFISREEYRAFRETGMEKSKKRIEERAIKSFERMDLDNDTRLSELEYVYKGKDPNDPNAVAGVNPFSNVNNNSRAIKRVSRDGNSDGMITKSEDEAYRRYRFSRMDKDKDGIVTKKEARYLFSQGDAKNQGDVEVVVNVN